MTVAARDADSLQAPARDAMRLRVAPGIVGATALSRMIGIGAARAQLSVNAVDQAMEIADLLADFGADEVLPGSLLEATVLPGAGRLELSIGDLQPGGAQRLLDAGTPATTIAGLTATSVVVAGKLGERLVLEVADAIRDVSPVRGTGSAGRVGDAQEERTADFAISTAPDGASGVHVVTIRGEIDIFTAPAVKLAAREAVFSGRNRIVLDLTETTFLDSTGLGVVIGLARLVRPDGDIAIVNVNPTILKTFEITGLDDIFAVRATLEDAIAALTAD